MYLPYCVGNYCHKKAKLVAVLVHTWLRRVDSDCPGEFLYPLVAAVKVIQSERN